MTNRFLLWTIGAGSSASLVTLSLAQEAMRSALPVEALTAMRTGFLPAMAVLGFTCAASYGLAFAPPRWYARRFERNR